MNSQEIKELVKQKEKELAKLKKQWHKTISKEKKYDCTFYIRDALNHHILHCQTVNGGDVRYKDVKQYYKRLMLRYFRDEYYNRETYVNVVDNRTGNTIETITLYGMKF